MSPAPRTFLRYAFPVLGALFLAYALLGTRSGPEREKSEAAIRLRWESADEAPAVKNEIATYLARHGEQPDAVWFAVEAYAHLRDPADALGAVLDRPSIRDAAGTPRRLARVLSDSLSDERGRPGTPSLLSVRLLLARLDADDADARREWDAIVPNLVVPALMAYYVPASRTPSHGAAAIADGFARRSEVREFRTAAALLRSGPAFLDDVPWLLEIFHSPWREERRPSWQNVTRTLGATGAPRALAALRAMHEKAVSTGDVGVRDAIDVGLAASGDVDARERVFALVSAGAGWPAALYATGLAQRLAQGDATVVPRLVELWDRTTQPVIHIQLAEGVLLADPPPPASPAWARWADELVAAPDLLSRSIGHAYRYRTGVEKAFDGLATDLVATSKLVDLANPSNPDDADASAAVEVLRAWMRWG